MNGAAGNILLRPLKIALIACLLLLPLRLNAKAAEAVASLDAEIAFRTVYAREKGHKALAVAPESWNMVTNRASAAKAKEEALRRCNDWVRKKPWGHNSRCELFAVDDKIVWAKPLPGPPLGQALPPPDDILDQAMVFKPEGGHMKGVVLALHGCGKGTEKTTQPYQDSWFDFFRARGLQVYFPNSYLDPKVKPICGDPDPETQAAASETDRIRIAQAKRSIGELRKRHPALPIYVWGQSAGGNIAQALDDDVAGMFVVSSWCGFGTPELELVRRNIPILFVFGEDDDELVKNQKITAKFMNKKCGAYYRTKKRKLIIAAQSNHWTTIWRQNTMDAVASMLGQKSFQLKASTTQGALEGEVKQAFEKDFPAEPGRKAFIVGPRGIFAISGGWTNMEDAIQSALYDCARKAGAPYAEGGKQTCQVYATGAKSDDRLETEELPAGSE